MLGRRESHHDRKVMLSQGTFAARLEELVSRTPDEDARLLKLGKEGDLKDDVRCPLRKYFKNGDDPSILKIVLNFFGAVEKVFKKEWDDDDGLYILRKSVGYTGLIIVFRHLLEEGFQNKNLSEAFFENKIAEMKVHLGRRELTSDNFPSSGAGAIGFAKALLGVQDLKYGVIEAPNIDDIRLEA